MATGSFPGEPHIDVIPKPCCFKQKPWALLPCKLLRKEVGFTTPVLFLSTEHQDSKVFIYKVILRF